MAKIFNFRIASVGENMKKLEPSSITGRTVKWYSSFKHSLMIPQSVK
jgi:hypothetical protein